MPEFLNAGRQQSHTDGLDVAVIRIDQLKALASLLSVEEVASKFAGLEVSGQVAIFGLFEDALSDVRSALERTTEAQA
jgi:hypothetical protein